MQSTVRYFELVIPVEKNLVYTKEKCLFVFISLPINKMHRKEVYIMCLPGSIFIKCIVPIIIIFIQNKHVHSHKNLLESLCLLISDLS